MIDVVESLLLRLSETTPTRDRLTVLVLGDPSTELCTAFADSGHSVSCCPDLQRQGHRHHEHVFVESIEDLQRVESRWDLAVATNGFRRMQEVHRPERLADFFDWLSQRCTAIIVEAPRVPLAADLHDLGPYKVLELLRSFMLLAEIDESSDDMSGPSRPLIVASNHGLLLGGDWIPLSAMTCLFDTRAVADKSTRTFRHGSDVIKIDLGSEGYFQSCEALSEARFLAGATAEQRQALALPRIRDVRRGRAVNLVVREWIDGGSSAPGMCANQPELVGRFVELACRFAELGLFHNDLRPWNVIWTDHAAVFVDYANVSRLDSDVQGLPQVLAFAGTIASLLSDDLPWGNEYLPALTARVQNSGLLNRWTEPQLLGKEFSDSPWLSIAVAKDEMFALLPRLVGMNVNELLMVVVSTVMDVHTQRGARSHG